MNEDLLVNDFVNYLLIERGCSTNTIVCYRNDLDNLKLYLINKYFTNKFNWNQIKISHIRSYLGYLHTEMNNSKSSVHRRVCTFKSFFRFMKENEFIDNDPALKLSYPKRKKSIPKFLEVEQMLNLLNACKSHLHRTILEVLYSTGARRSEIRNMNLQDINLERKTIVIRNGKGGKDRVVYLTDRACRWLKNYIVYYRPLEWEKIVKLDGVTKDLEKAVFISMKGNRISNKAISEFINKLAKELYYENVTAHSIRHTFASHLVMNDVNLRVISDLLGHSNLESTKIYANISDSYKFKEFKGSLPLR